MERVRQSKYKTIKVFDVGEKLLYGGLNAEVMKKNMRDKTYNLRITQSSWDFEIDVTAEWDSRYLKEVRDGTP